MKLRDSNFISGIAVTDKGFLLITDSDQNNVKCISPDSKCVSVLGLESSPNEVTMIGETKAAIATEDGVDILKIEKSGSLSIAKKLKMDHEVWGIAEYRGNLLVTCNGMYKTMKLIDLNGKELWSLCSNGRVNLFEYPCGVAWADFILKVKTLLLS